MEEFLKIIQQGGIIGVLIYAVYQLQMTVKYLSKELKEEIKANDEAIERLYQQQITDLKEEFKTILENDGKSL